MHWPNGPSRSRFLGPCRRRTKGACALEELRVSFGNGRSTRLCVGLPGPTKHSRLRRLVFISAVAGGLLQCWKRSVLLDEVM